MIDNNYRAVTALANRCVVLVNGEVVFDDTSAALLAVPALLHATPGV